MKTSFEFNRMRVFTRSRKPDEKCSIEIGGMDAELTEDLIKKNPKLKKALEGIAKELCKQMKCEGVSFSSIAFQRHWFKK